MGKSKADQVGTRSIGVVATGESPYCTLSPVPVSAVEMRPGFWKPRMDANREHGIPALFRLLEEHGTLHNFQRLAGRSKEERRGPYFRDSDIFKWMEAAAFVLQLEDDREVAEMLDRVIDDVVAAQCDDGYLNTFFVDDLADQRFRNLRAEHELYCAGHLFQAAVAHHRATGERKLLDAALRYADYLTTMFGPGKIEIADGHPEVEMALVELYRTTGERKYLDLAGFFLSVQEFAKKQAIQGHAVRAGYLACGAADYFAETGDRAAMDALMSQWTDAVERKMYVTGGVGSRHEGEAFGDPYELPNERAYAETCAAIANIMWNWRMLAIKGECRFADVIERALYNGFLSGVSLDGTHYFYVNPLACYGEHQRRPWYGCTCCPTNVVRMIASVPGYFYSTSDEGIWVHLFHNSRLDWHLHDGRSISLEQKTRYPWDGDVEITVSPEEPSEFVLFLRVPAWCGSASVSVSGEAPQGAGPGDYLRIERTWRPGDIVRLEMEMPVALLESDPRVRENLGCVAIQRGPVVYCVESVDNPDVPIRDLSLQLDEELSAEHRPHLLGGVTIVKGRGVYSTPAQDRGLLYRELDSVKYDVAECDLIAVPYYAWANRGPSHMSVWLPGE